jgi:diaphanous 1
MPEDTLIVPTLLPSGTIHFTEVSKQGSAQDVINSIMALGEVPKGTLGSLEDRGWALQRIRREKHGRTWEQDELEALGDGKLLYRSLSVNG